MKIAPFHSFALILLASLILQSATVEIQFQCNLDSDCGNGLFCQNSFCERCIPCEKLFNRAAPIANGCAKMENDCGKCLPGYVAEDLTSQRHSVKCFPTEDIRPSLQKPSSFVQPSSFLYILLAVFIATVIILLVLINFSILSISKNEILNEPEREPYTDNSHLNLMHGTAQLPPPYEPSGSTHYHIRMTKSSELSYALGPPDQDILNHATPFEPYHQSKRNSTEFVGEFPFEDVHSEDGNGSTETIPSLWEPNDSENLNPQLATAQEIIEISQNPQQNNYLVRSYSLDSTSPSARTVNQFSSPNESRSDPGLDGGTRFRLFGGQSYAHRHVQLAMFRSSLARNSSEIVELNVPTMHGQNDDLNYSFIDERISNSCSLLPFVDEDPTEPNAPHSFVFDEDHNSLVGVDGAIGGSDCSSFFSRSLNFLLAQSSYNPVLSRIEGAGENERGSQDSGFFDHSRRRPASEDFEFEMTLTIKRSRPID